MRVIIFFDLPTETKAERREYARFRKYLIKNGFVMLQYSVYAKLALNSTVANAICSNLKKNKPLSGTVELLTITEKQFSKMESIVGTRPATILDTENRTVVL